jgi:hypothetical protein
MTDTMTSQNIVLSSWDTLYIKEINVPFQNDKIFSSTGSFKTQDSNRTKNLLFRPLEGSGMWTIKALLK